MNTQPIKQLETLPEFVARLGITLEWERDAAPNPLMDEKPDPKHPRFNWKCTLRMGDATLETPFNTGQTEERKFFEHFPLGDKKLKACFLPHELKMETGGTWLKIPVPPTAEDVLCSILSDCQSVDSSTDFEDWASSMGWDTDSRKAERCYNACLQETVKIRKFIGNKNYNYALNELEPY